LLVCLLAAPKKDDTGAMKAVRVCNDVRLLNMYLERNDRFILPCIPDILATFGGFDHSMLLPSTTTATMIITFFIVKSNVSLDP
jgi:hypothetical protein